MTGQEKAGLSPGARVIVYMNGKQIEETVFEKRQDQIVLQPLVYERNGFSVGRMACLTQMLGDQCLFAMLRCEERRGSGRERKDLFRIIPGTLLYIWPELHRLVMYTWTPLKVFAPYQPDKVLLEDEVFLFALSETEVSLLVGKPIPTGAFADCTLPLDGEPLTTRVVLTRCEDVDGGAGYRAHFILIDQTLRPRLREFLFNERARRLQAARVK